MILNFSLLKKYLFVKGGKKRKIVNQIQLSFIIKQYGKSDSYHQLMLYNKILQMFMFCHNNYRSDVLGQFMPLVGVDWSQNGVAHLFSAIKVFVLLMLVTK